MLLFHGMSAYHTAAIQSTQKTKKPVWLNIVHHKLAKLQIHLSKFGREKRKLNCFQICRYEGGSYWVELLSDRQYAGQRLHLALPECVGVPYSKPIRECHCQIAWVQQTNMRLPRKESKTLPECVCVCHCQNAWVFASANQYDSVTHSVTNIARICWCSLQQTKKRLS